MNYGELLARSWKIFWKHKNLWLVGVIPYAFYALLLIPMFLLPVVLLQPMPSDVLSEDWMAGLFVAFTGVSLLGYLLVMTWSKAANTLGILQAEKGQARLSFVELVNQGSRYFLRVLGLYSLFTAALLVIYLLVFAIISLAVAATFGLAMICIVPFIFLLIPVIGLGYLLVEQSNAALFAEDLGVIEAVKRGWHVLRKRFWHLVLMGVILYAGYYVLSMIIFYPLSMVFLSPMMVPMIMDDLDAMVASIPYMMIGMALFMFLSMVISGFINIYIRNIWMLTYLELKAPAAQAVPGEHGDKAVDA